MGDAEGVLRWLRGDESGPVDDKDLCAGLESARPVGVEAGAGGGARRGRG